MKIIEDDIFSAGKIYVDDKDIRTFIKKISSLNVEYITTFNDDIFSTDEII